MRKHAFLIFLVCVFAIEMIALLLFYANDRDNTQDAVSINEAVHSVEDDWGTLGKHVNRTSLDYVVLDTRGNVLYRTKSGLSESIHAAILHRDTILDITVAGSAAGKIIIYNDSAELFRLQKQKILIILSAAALVQCIVCIGYSIYLYRSVIKPFQKLRGFAQRIAGGNLDVPLAMDRHNLFGAFTESFDIMRSELKKARNAEAQASTSKKELVAKLSHDIKTPVASIKAASEVGAALSDNERIKDNYTQIIHKADQINSLITNLFTATLEELQQLSVVPGDMESTELKELLENADYLHYANIPPIPSCMIFADKLRLQQVFDNILSNSYKYANTKIEIKVRLDGSCLAVSIEDYGQSVRAEELPLLKEKFRRGSNAANIEGTGLGLYISDHFMKEMNGELVIDNGDNGLKACVLISLSGTI